MTPPEELLWGTVLGGTISPITPENAIDKMFDDQVADWGSADGTVIWTAVEDTFESDLSIVESITAEIRFMATSILSNDWLDLEIYDGTSWTRLELFNSGNQPPIILTTKQYDVASILDTVTKINACQFRFTSEKVGGPDCHFQIDEARLLVKKLNINAYSNVDIEESVNASIAININVFDSISVEENIPIGDLIIDIFDETLIVEDIQIEKISLELEIETAENIFATENVEAEGFSLILEAEIAENINIDENISFYLDILLIDINDLFLITESISFYLDILLIDINDLFLITESISVIDLMVEIGVVTDTSSISENTVVSLTELFVSGIENIGITEFTHLLNIIIELVVQDTIAVNEHANIFDIVIELGPVSDFVNCYEVLTMTLSCLFVNVSENVAVTDIPIIESDSGVGVTVVDSAYITEYVSVNLTELFINREEDIAIEEYTRVFDIVIEMLTYDNLSVEENIFLANALIEGLFIDNILIIENTIITELYTGDLYAVFCTATPRRRIFTSSPRRRMFTTIKSCSQEGVCQ